MIKYAIFENFPKSMKKYESMLCGNPESKTSTPSDGPPLRIKTKNLVQITEINIKTSTVWKKTAKNNPKLYNVTTCNVFLTKKGPKRPKPDFSRNFHLFFFKSKPKMQF